MADACRCRSGGTTILPASWPATHLPLFAPLSNAGSLRVDRTQHVEKSRAIIAQSRGAAGSAYLYTPVGEMRPWAPSGAPSVTMPQEVLAWFVGEVRHTMNCVSWQCCAEPLEYAQ
jgi:hypothetical protein